SGTYEPQKILLFLSDAIILSRFAVATTKRLPQRRRDRRTPELARQKSCRGANHGRQRPPPRNGQSTRESSADRMLETMSAFGHPMPAHIAENERQHDHASIRAEDVLEQDAKHHAHEHEP